MYKYTIRLWRRRGPGRSCRGGVERKAQQGGAARPWCRNPGKCRWGNVRPTGRATRPASAILGADAGGDGDDEPGSGGRPACPPGRAAGADGPADASSGAAGRGRCHAEALATVGGGAPDGGRGRPTGFFGDLPCHGGGLPMAAGGVGSAAAPPAVRGGANLEVAVTLAEDHLAAGAGEPGDAGRRPNKQAPVPAPRRRVPAPGQAERLPALSPTNPFAALVPSRGAEPSGAAPEPRRAAQTPGPECWKCGQPGHLRRDCPLMEVGQVFRVAGAPAPSPGPGGTYSIPTDASDRGLGAVLSQQVRGADRPVLYISRKLAERERRYSTMEKECLAIRWAVGSLRYYLLGRSFTLCSDHAPLQWLHRMKDANARITRWYLALQPFKFKVIHRPGAQMAVADFLSRSRGGGGSWLGRTAPRPRTGGGVRRGGAARGEISWAREAVRLCD
ncbi:skin secretory protein xP2-like [Astatotilapia calliptera]|uniref:skin secretory protein xP2-like n=1 Tax=Astatotilapia calliptera TaxID=8154 RepID=UPI000E4182ED|nr:skin secretory protein xP2-like [Astatotilapia calliptera]